MQEGVRSEEGALPEELAALTADHNEQEHLLRHTFIDATTQRGVWEKWPGEEKGVFVEEEDSERLVPKISRHSRHALRQLAFWATVIVIPNAIIAALASCPLGDPTFIFVADGSWPQLIIVNPFIMTGIGYLSVTAYFGAVQSANPFSAFLPMLFIIYCMEIIIMVPLVSIFGYFEFIGLISFGVAYSTAFIGAYLIEYFDSTKPPGWQTLFWKFLRIACANFVHLTALCVYVIFFREVPADVQPVLSLGLAIFTFINRKAILSFSDHFPLELGMLISGFWVNNMTDMFQTLAYPNIKDPVTFLYIWAMQFFGDIANLVFLTRSWFRFRTWVKGLFMCNRESVESYEDLPDDRGHSNNRPGYLRRQVRFYFWRILSKLAAIVFYLFISTLLRYGPNKEYYNFSENPHIPLYDDSGREVSRLSWEDYMHSVIYVSCNSVFVALAGFVGYFIVRCWYPDTYNQLKPAAKKLHKDRAHIGYIVAVVAHNGLLALAFIQYHERIWWYDSLDSLKP